MTLNQEAFAKALAAGIAAYDAAVVSDGEWIEWTGGNDSPVADADMIDVRFRDGDVDVGMYTAGSYEWRHIYGHADIVAYRLAK